MKKLFLFLLPLAFSLFAAAQADTGRISFKASLNYNSNLNYYGRTDSLTSSGFFPMLEVWMPSGWYLNAAPIFVQNRLQPFAYAGTVATLGNQKVEDNWIRHFYLLRPFYTAEAQVVQSALQLQTGYSLSHLHKIVNITLGADLKFSNKIDLGGTFGLDHLIYVRPEKMNLIVDPSFYVYAGTQQFSKTYTTRKNRGLLPPAQQTSSRTGSRFNVLAYELSVPVIYTRGSLQLMATPAVVLPQNLITVEGRPDLSEQGKNTLYATLTAKYTF